MSEQISKDCDAVAVGRVYLLLYRTRVERLQSPVYVRRGWGLLSDSGRHK
jgi:hypothetical protein